MRECILEVTVLDEINTLRSMRHLKPDPIERRDLLAILKAAGKAPSGGNAQPWEFIVVTDSDVKKELRELTVQGLEIYANSDLRIPKESVHEFLSPSNPVAAMA